MKIRRNFQRAVSIGEQIMGQTERRWRFAGAADSHSGEREGLLWESVSPSTAPTTSSDPETVARKYMTSPGNSKGQVSFCLRVSHRILSVIIPCLQVTPGSHLSDFLL